MKIGSMTGDQLVARYIEISSSQYDALMRDEIAKFNKLFDKMMAVEEELKKRDGDQRQLLLPLYAHKNAHVRLNAIKATLAIAPETARKALEDLAESREGFQSMDAGMCMRALDDGTYKPT